MEERNSRYTSRKGGHIGKGRKGKKKGLFDKRKTKRNFFPFAIHVTFPFSYEEGKGIRKKEGAKPMKCEGERKRCLGRALATSPRKKRKKT